jgi:hypothetical protein
VDLPRAKVSLFHVFSIVSTTLQRHTTAHFELALSIRPLWRNEGKSQNSLIANKPLHLISATYQIGEVLSTS